MANQTFEGRLASLGDIQKTYMWELYIPSIEELDTDDMLLRVRSAQIPGRTIEQITSFFMGTQQKFPGKTTYTETFTTLFEEFEDRKVFKAINSWMDYIFNYSPSDSNGGAASGDKKALSKTITLRMLSTQNEKIGEVKFFGCWPQNIAEVEMSYEAGEAVKHTVTWSFDFWRNVN